MTIASAALKYNLKDMYTRQVEELVDLAVAILVYEPQPSRAILRRAAVYTIYSLYSAVHSALTDGGLEAVDSLPNLSLEKWDAVDRLMRQLQHVDGDELTRGHANEVVHGLAELNMDLVIEMDERRMEGAMADDMGLEGGLRGLDIDSESKNEQGGGRPKIEEVE